MKTARCNRGLGFALGLLALALPVGSAFAEQMIEEILVTARQQSETLQDVPVTVAAFTQEDLERYNIRDMEEAANLVPNFQIRQGGSGNGSNLFLRGIGSSSISAAFDQSVAINIDGVVGNIGRLIHNGYLDMGQLEVLKGPQSLYFGKSATAGVVSITTNDPGDEFEIEGMLGRENEFDSIYGQFIVSAPISDTFGARLAIGYRERDELYENLNPSAAVRYRGDETKDARLTLVWEPSDTVKARFKLGYSELENDGPGGNTEEFCPEGSLQPSAALSNGVILPGVDDCKLNGNTSAADLLFPLYVGNPLANGGVPYLEQETILTSLQVDWDMSERFTLSSVTGYIDLDHSDFEIYDYNAGIFGGGHTNTYQGLSQEFRLASQFDGPLNFLAGFFYQDVEQEFLAHQYAVNIGLVAVDPITGNGYDYNKNHFLDTEVYSGYIAGYWDVTEKLELTAGVRYTDEQKEGYITIPYVHAFLRGAFGAPERIDGLEFDDDNLSPEIAVNYYVNDNVSIFASWKEAFKSGGIDNSALPSASLDPNVNPDFPDFLIYESEEAKGWEAGFKARLADGAVRWNGTAFHYIYDDLQTQLFDSVAIQFTTLNASELTTFGLETDFAWITPIDGLMIRGAAAWTDAEYTDDFFNADGENLSGQDRERNATLTGNLGVTYDFAAFNGWRISASTDVRYSSEYDLQATINPYEQDAYDIWDAAVRLYSDSGRYELSLIGRNLGDEIIAYSSGARPGACANFNPAQVGTPLACNANALAIEQDQVVNTGLGRQVMLQFRVRY